jgi:sorting nexin-1/2
VYSTFYQFANSLQLIEIWETFLMQLDTDEGDNFVPPAGVVASPSTEQPPSVPNSENHESENSDARAAAEATREIEE